LQPALALTSIPDAVLGSEHPSPTFAVEHGKIANREPEGARLQTAVPTLLDQAPISSLCIRERVDSHGGSIARRVERIGRCRIR